MPTVRTMPRDIVDTAAETGSLRAFCAAIEAAGLAARLRGEGPFTVFAPTDAAFDRFAGQESRSKLRAILTYHLLAGRFQAAEIIKSSSVRTVQGTGLTVRFTDGRMHVNNAEVIRADIDCRNGLIHIIDTVLIPR